MPNISNDYFYSLPFLGNALMSHAKWREAERWERDFYRNTGRRVKYPMLYGRDPSAYAGATAQSVYGGLLGIGATTGSLMRLF